ASVFFFFSSRRRHTRFSRDWSSDVCSSDLVAELVPRVSRTNDVADSHYSLRLNSDRSGALAGAGAGAGRARTLAQRQLHRANEGGLLRDLVHRAVSHDVGADVAVHDRTLLQLHSVVVANPTHRQTGIGLGGAVHHARRHDRRLQRHDVGRTVEDEANVARQRVRDVHPRQTGVAADDRVTQRAVVARLVGLAQVLALPDQSLDLSTHGRNAVVGPNVRHAQQLASLDEGLVRVLVLGQIQLVGVVGAAHRVGQLVLQPPGHSAGLRDQPLLAELSDVQGQLLV